MTDDCPANFAAQVLLSTAPPDWVSAGTIGVNVWDDPAIDAFFTVSDPSQFQDYDVIRVAGSQEVMQITSVEASTIYVIRGYGGTTPENLYNGAPLEKYVGS